MKPHHFLFFAKLALSLLCLLEGHRGVAEAQAAMPGDSWPPHYAMAQYYAPSAACAPTPASLYWRDEDEYADRPRMALYCQHLRMPYTL